MDALELLRGLFRHMEWADAVVWTAAFRAPAATGDSVVRQRLYHVHMVQRAFLLIWRNQPLDFKGTESFTPEQLARWGYEYHREVAGYLDSLAPASLDTAVHLPWASRFATDANAIPRDPSLGETLMQVAAHSTHHRGQINVRLKELEVEPPLTDFIAWVWFGKPAPAWPSPAEPAPA